MLVDTPYRTDSDIDMAVPALAVRRTRSEVARVAFRKRPQRTAHGRADLLEERKSSLLGKTEPLTDDLMITQVVSRASEKAFLVAGTGCATQNKSHPTRGQPGLPKRAARPRSSSWVRLPCILRHSRHSATVYSM